MENTLIQRAIVEINNPTIKSTSHCLKSFSLSTSDNKPHVERVDFTSFESNIVVYFHLREETLFLAVWFSNDLFQLTDVSIENSHSVYFTVSSENLSFKQLLRLTTLGPLKGWSIGELMRNGKSKYADTRLMFSPNKSQSFEFETAIKLLLDELEKDSEGVVLLAQYGNATISVLSNIHTEANQEVLLNNQMISRINQLNLNVKFEIYPA